MDAETFSSIPLIISTVTAPELVTIAASSNEYHKLLAQYPQISRAEISTSTLKRGTQHYIPTKGLSTHARACHLAPDKLRIAKEEFQKMKDKGIGRKSSSPWSSPLHMVPKAPAGWTACGDYHCINDATTPDRFPVPHIQDLSAHPSGCKIFSKIGLLREYNQIPVLKEDIPKTAVITSFDLYEFLHMHFSLKNAAQAF